MQHTISLPYAMKFELSGWYNSPGIWGNWLAGSQYDISVRWQKKILQEKGSIKISFSDIFQRNRWSGESTFGDFFMSGGGRWDSQQIKVNFKYNFGGIQVKSARQRTTGLEEEAGRLGG